MIFDMGTDKNNFEYVQTEILENLKDAKNYNRALIQLALAAHVLTPETKILDFGAGLGTFAEMFRDKGLTVDCFEIDEKESAILEEKGFRVYRDFDSIETDTYDFIYSYNVLEHIEDDISALRNLRRILKPEGTLFIFVPAFQSLYSNMDKAVGHHRRYHKKDLTDVIAEAGLSVEKMRYFDTIGFLASYVFKLLGSQHEDITRGKIIFFDRYAFPFNKIADPFFSRQFGKNAYAVCRKKT